MGLELQKEAASMQGSGDNVGNGDGGDGGKDGNPDRFKEEDAIRAVECSFADIVREDIDGDQLEDLKSAQKEMDRVVRSISLVGNFVLNFMTATTTILHFLFHFSMISKYSHCIGQDQELSVCPINHRGDFFL
jgi:hypothetical protein